MILEVFCRYLAQTIYWYCVDIGIGGIDESILLYFATPGRGKLYKKLGDIRRASVIGLQIKDIMRWL